jgi:hypothetical protein
VEGSSSTTMSAEKMPYLHDIADQRHRVVGISNVNMPPMRHYCWKPPCGHFLESSQEIQRAVFLFRIVKTCAQNVLPSPSKELQSKLLFRRIDTRIATTDSHGKERRVTRMDFARLVRTIGKLYSIIRKRIAFPIQIRRMHDPRVMVRNGILVMI